jgi:hypothetical protein
MDGKEFGGTGMVSGWKGIGFGNAPISFDRAGSRTP